MAAKIQKWGNSFGLRIPKSIIEKCALELNSEVEIEHKDGAIIIFPKKKKESLKELIDQITPENIHDEEDFGREGKEVW